MEQNLPERNEVPVSMTWRLEDIYETADLWEKDLEKANALAKELAGLEGHIVESPDTLLKAMKLFQDTMETISSVYSYANMKHDQDTAEPENQKLIQRAQMAYVGISEMLSFMDPEILSLPEERLKEFYEEEKGLEEFRVTLDDVYRMKEHSLSKIEEKILAASGDMAETPSNAFGMLSNADMKFPEIEGEDGEKIGLSNGRFVPLQMSHNRDLRKRSFEAFYEKYKEFKNTFAALYDGQVKQQIFYAKSRGYESTFKRAVDGNNVDPAVCDNLIASIHDNMDKMHRYVGLRKKLLGVDELHMYDVYAPMVQDYTVKVSYEDAMAISLEALRPLGEDYIEVVKEAYENRWIDVLENKGKRSGAYSSGVYGVHPYMLLNFNGTLDDIFTLVHEMGHSMHTYYSSKNQSFLNSEYKIFVAEVASTTNEVLLLEYLLKKAEDEKEKANLINHYLESFKGTVYRQTMFIEFERKTNEMAEQGIPLTADTLSELYLSLNKEYFGDEMISDPLIAYEWSRIPHFYYNFYVYQYATSYAAAVDIAHRILEGEENALSNYREFLRSGCTKDPVSLLKIAGVDLSTRKPIDSALKIFDEAITVMEEISDK